MLFVIVMEVLNSLFQEADRRRALTPLPRRAITHRASLYADDLVLLVAPQTADLDCVLQILPVVHAEHRGLSLTWTNVSRPLSGALRR